MDEQRIQVESVLGTTSGDEGTEGPVGSPPTLSLPFYDLRDGIVLSPLRDPLSIASEQYRMIKARLDFLSRSEGKRIRTLVVTSPTSGDGKTLTALNLALVLAQDESKSVLLIDADLRKPGIRDYFVHRPKLGLIELLRHEVKLTSVLFRPQGSRLIILPSGARTTNPAELLASHKMEQLLSQLSARFDHVILDTPPVIPFVDADMLGAFADASLLIVRAGWTPKKRAAQAVGTMSKHNLIGLVLNDVQPTPLDRYYYRQDYEYYRKKKKKKSS